MIGGSVNNSNDTQFPPPTTTHKTTQMFGANSKRKSPACYSAGILCGANCEMTERQMAVGFSLHIFRRISIFNTQVYYTHTTGTSANVNIHITCTNNFTHTKLTFTSTCHHEASPAHVTMKHEMPSRSSARTTKRLRSHAATQHN